MSVLIVVSLSTAELDPLLAEACRLAAVVGQRLLRFHPCRHELQVRRKADHSFLTEADTMAHEFLCKGLQDIEPGLPVLSEESEDIPFSKRSEWPLFWLIDPLDGTHDFVHGRASFSINIALVADHQAILGVVYGPWQDVCYYAHHHGKSWCRRGNAGAEMLSVRVCPAQEPTVTASANHAVNGRLSAFRKRLGSHLFIPMGSALKSCLVAEGGADIYPRFGPTFEWDTAAAQCIVEQSGGYMVALPNGARLRYNDRESLLNPDFFVFGDAAQQWRQYTAAEDSLSKG